jgi:uncharacterized protein (DUF1697 family)
MAAKTYVVLLRGINVGGKNRVEMAKLRELFEGLGYERVETYINSGNVIFDAPKIPKAKALQQSLKTTFALDVPVLVIAGKTIRDIAAAIPDEWINDRESRKSDVIYLFDESNRATILDEIKHKPEIESFMYVDGALITTIERVSQTKGSLLKIIGTPLYKTMTIRNVTTARKLASLVSERMS